MESPLSEAQLRRLRQTHVCVCIPCYGGMLTEATLRGLLELANLANAHGIPWTLLTMANESLVTRARNNLAAQMMAHSGTTHLMFIDADIRFSAHDVCRLLLHDKDVVGGCCPAKRMPATYVVNKLAGGKRQGDLFEVTTLGTGFLLIKRNVFATMFEAYPQSKYVDSMGIGSQYEPFMYGLFDTAIDEAGRYLSEDWAFCVRWKNLGGEVWADRGCVLGHVGAHTFAGDPELLRQL